jgi:hypothetical protein
MSDQSDVNPVAQSLDYIGQILKANSAAIEQIDKLIETDPKAKAQYQKDIESLQQVRDDTADMMGLLFESLHGQATREAGGYRYIDTVMQRAIPYRYLRRAGATDVPNLIKNLRRLQLSQFAMPAHRKKYGRDIGFALTWKYPGQQPTKKQKAEIEMWESRLTERFFFPPGDDRPNFAQFLGTCYADFFDLDDITIAIERDATFRPIAMQIQDPSLWVPTLPRVRRIRAFDSDIMDVASDPINTIEVEVPDMDYLMILGGMKQAAVSRDVMVKSHFFKRSDWRTWRRGYSIQEQAINITTMILNAMTYNASNFTNNRTPLGAFVITGGYTNQMQLEKLKRLLWAQMSGAANQHKIPVIGLPDKGDAKWVNIHGTAKEMEYYTGMTLFMSILFGLSGTDPNEVGLANFHDAIRNSGLNQESQDGIFRKSRDTGLNTFLSHMESTLNMVMSDGMNIWETITGMPVVVEFKGIAEEDLKAKTEVQTKRLNATASINELRQEDGLEDAKYDLGEGLNLYDIVAVGNPGVAGFIRQIMQQKQAEEQMQQQQAAMAQQAGAAGGGQPGGPGGEEGGPPAEMSERDQALIDQYGAPEQGGQ